MVENYNNIFDSPFFIQNIFEQHNLGVVVTNYNFEIEHVNNKFFEITGYNISEVLGKNIDFLYANNSNKPLNLSTIKERSVFETSIKTKTDTKFDAWISVFNFIDKVTQKPNKLIILDKFLCSEESNKVKNLGFLFEKFYEHSPVGVVFCTPTLEVLKANEVFCNWLQYTEAEVKILGVKGISHPNDMAINLKIVSENLETGNIDYKLEKRYITKYGSIIYTKISATVIYDQYRNAEYIMGYVINITEQKLKEQALQESENIFKTLFEESPLGVAMVSKTGEILKVNKQICTFTKHTAAELEGRNAGEFSITARKNFDFLAQKIEVDKNFATTLKPMKIERKYIDKMGQIVYLSINISPVFKPQTELLDYFIVMIENITDKKNTEFKATKNENMFKSIFENNAMPICILGKNDIFLNVNPAFCNLLGYNTNELSNLKLTDIIHEESERLTKQQVKNFEQGNTPYYKNLQRILKKKNGDKVYVKADLTGIYNTENSYLYEVAIMEDISEKIKNEIALKKSLEMQNAILMALPDLTFHLNKNGKCLNIFLNNNNQKDLYNDYENIIGRNIKEIMPQPFADIWIELITESLEQKTIKTKEYVLTIDNNKKYFKALISPINDTELVFCAHNITELKVAQIQLQEKILELSQKNKQLESYINSNIALENFAYIAAHDLREPLRSISSFTQILALEIHKNEQSNPQIQESIEFITSSTQQLNNIINDLLEFSKIKNEKIRYQKIDFEVIIKGVIAQLSKLIAETNTQINCNIPQNINLEGSYSQLVLVFQNLIQNAIKFRKKDQPCIINISATELQNEWQFEVTDNGIGIEPQYHEKIFILFRRLHSRRDYQGSGIGLTLCKEIVEKHGGVIFVKSELTVGTTFCFTLPKNQVI